MCCNPRSLIKAIYQSILYAGRHRKTLQSFANKSLDFRISMAKQGLSVAPSVSL